MITKTIKMILITIVFGLNNVSAKSIEINGVKIGEAEIVKISKDYMRVDYDKATQKEKEEILQKIIDFKIVVSEAKSNQVQNEKKYKEIMEILKDMILIQIYTEKEYEKYKLTDEDLKRYYEQNPDKFESKSSLNASHIVVAKEKEAQDIIKKLILSKNKKEDFKKLAQEHSIGPSGVSGGELGWFKRGEMVESFEKASFKLKKDEFTKNPIKTRFGYHIIYLNDERKSEKKTFKQFKAEVDKDPGIVEEYREKQFAQRGYERMENLKKNKYKIKIID